MQNALKYYHFSFFIIKPPERKLHVPEVDITKKFSLLSFGYIIYI